MPTETVGDGGGLIFEHVHTHATVSTDPYLEKRWLDPVANQCICECFLGLLQAKVARAPVRKQLVYRGFGVGVGASEVRLAVIAGVMMRLCSHVNLRNQSMRTL